MEHRMNCGSIIVVGVVVALCAAVIGGWHLFAPGRLATVATQTKSIRVAISPYQDIGMVVNLKPMGLEKKYGVDVELQTLAWEDIVPAMASHGTTFDLGYASFIGT